MEGVWLVGWTRNLQQDEHLLYPTVNPSCSFANYSFETGQDDKRSWDKSYPVQFSG